MSASCSRRRAGAHGRDERPLGALGVAHLDEAAGTSAPSRAGVGARRRQRVEREARRHRRRSRRRRRRGRGRAPPPGPRPSSRGTRFTRQRERRQAAAPAAAAPRDAELEARRGTRRRRSGRRRRARSSPSPAPARCRARGRRAAAARWCASGSLGGARSTQTSSPRELDREAAQVVGQLVERAAGAEVEAGVVPVAGEDAVRRPCRGGAGSPCAGSGCRPRSTSSPSAIRQIVWPLDAGRRAGRLAAQLRRARRRGRWLRCRRSSSRRPSVAQHPRTSSNGSSQVASELTIGELSARSGVATSALRFYERAGLIESTPHRRQPAPLRPRRRCGGIAFIQAGRAAGIPLERIGAALATLPAAAARRAAATGSGSRTRWRDDLDARIETLKALRDRLTHVHRLRLPLDRPVRRC